MLAKCSKSLEGILGKLLICVWLSEPTRNSYSETGLQSLFEWACLTLSNELRGINHA